MITGEDGIVAGLKPSVPFHKPAFTGEAAGYWANLGLLAGNPGAWTLGAPGVNGASVVANALGGALRFDNPSSGSAYLAKMAATIGANILGLMVYDLLWYNSGLNETTTGLQPLASAAFASRDILGSTNGDGVEAWMHCSTATTNVGAIANTTLSYTNQANTAGRSAGLVSSWPDTAVAGTMVPFGLQGSDRGVRSIQGVTLGTSYGGGQVELLALRRVSTIWLPPSTGDVFDWAALALPQLFNDSALYLAAYLSGTAAGAIAGELNYAHG